MKMKRKRDSSSDSEDEPLANNHQFQDKTKHELDSDDELPLTKSYPYRVITKSELQKETLERCEFCEAVFYNKYKMMIHNASHIIIPLFHQGIHQCTKCNSYFNTIESLEEHKLKHLNITNEGEYPEIIKSLLKKEPYTVLTKEEFGIKEEDVLKANILESFVLKQPVTLLTKETFSIENGTDNFDDDHKKLLESFVIKSPITLLDPLVMKSEVIYISDSDSSDSDIKPDIGETVVERQENRIKDRILFEEDNEIFKPIRPDVNLKATVDNLVKDLSANLKSNTIILGNRPHRFPNHTMYTAHNVQYESVHYDELKRPGWYKCKRCSASFPNRYELIIHDTNHIRYKRRLPFLCKMCDWYIDNNRWGLKVHQNMCHPGLQPQNKELKQCRQCNLKYSSFSRHLRNYHKIYICKVSDCDVTLKSHGDYKQHKFVHKNERIIGLKNDFPPKVWYTKMIKVCDMCFLFFKNKKDMHYTQLGNVSELGVRQQCERCGSVHFELNLVKLKAKKRAKYEYQTKKITNEDRLKSVQKRLKNLKLMNKF